MKKSFLECLDANFGTKEFDPARPVSEENLSLIRQAVCAAPTSFGLQAFHVIEITDQGIRQALYDIGRDQKQILEAPSLFLFCIRTDLDVRIEEYEKEALRQSVATAESLTKYKEKIRAVTAKYDLEKIKTWTGKQVYIALGFALAAAAELGIDVCPIEGFSKKGTPEILGFPDHTVPVVLLALGYRKSDAPYKRMRFPEDDLFSKR